MFIGGTRDRQNTWRTLAGVAGQWALNGFGFFAVEEKLTGHFIGTCGPHCPDGYPGLEIGWTLAKTAWGRGYATEAASAAIDWIFAQKPDLDHIISLIDARNRPSQKVAERLGEYKTEAIYVHPLAVRIDIWRLDRSHWRPIGV